MPVGFSSSILFLAFVVQPPGGFARNHRVSSLAAFCRGVPFVYRLPRAPPSCSCRSLHILAHDCVSCRFCVQSARSLPLRFVGWLVISAGTALSTRTRSFGTSARCPRRPSSTRRRSRLSWKGCWPRWVGGLPSYYPPPALRLGSGSCLVTV